MPRVRGIFVTGTGTEVGKSVVCAAICAALAARGKKVAAYKPVVTGLGTINHTLLTIEAARTGGLELLGVVLTPWPEEPSDLERSNREAIETLGNVAVYALPETSPDRLAEAGEELPLDGWFEEAEAA